MTEREHKFYFIEAECDQCDKHFEGHASDVSEDIWHHEEDDGHDIHIVREWERKIVYDDETGEVVETSGDIADSTTD